MSPNGDLFDTNLQKDYNKLCRQYAAGPEADLLASDDAFPIYSNDPKIQAYTCDKKYDKAVKRIRKILDRKSNKNAPDPAAPVLAQAEPIPEPVEEVLSNENGDNTAASATSGPSAPSQPAPISEPVDKSPSKKGGEEAGASAASVSEPTRELPQKTKVKKAAGLMALLISKPDLASEDDEDLDADVAAWRQEFIGPGKKLLHKVLEEAERHFREGLSHTTTYHSKILPIIQSAGCGKSRLLAEYGKHRVGVTYSLQEKRFPVRDDDVANFIRDCVERYTSREPVQYAGVIALLGATVENVSNLFLQRKEEERKSFAKWFHDTMDPSAYSKRSHQRIGFCNNVVYRAKVIAKEFGKSDSWAARFTPGARKDLISDNLVMARLIIPLNFLVERLRCYGIGHETNGIPLFFAFDGIEYGINGCEPKFVEILKEIFRTLTDVPVWTLFTSTQGKVARWVEPVPWGYGVKTEVEVEPFVSFLVDLDASRRIALDKDTQLSKSIDEISTIKHMAAFGRPSWSIFLHGKSGPYKSTALDTVWRKLMPHERFNPELPAHVLAILGNRVCLDQCLKRTKTVKLEFENIRRMRWITGVDSRRCQFTSTQIPEPLVAEVATEQMVRKDQHSCDPWQAVLTCLNREFFQKDQMEEGKAGGLIAQLLLACARDNMFRAALDNYYRMKKKPDILRVQDSDADQHVDYSRPFRTTAVLKALFVESDTILHTPAQVPGQQPDKSHTVDAAFKDSVINFTHFVATDTVLDTSSIKQLLQQLLYTHTALQLAPNQHPWDILIPTYHGDITQPFSSAALGAIIIQVENRPTSTRLNLSDTHSANLYKGLFGEQTKVLSLLLDLGNDKQKTKACPSYDRNTFAFRVAGYGEKSYAGQVPRDSYYGRGDVDAILRYDAERLMRRDVGRYNRRFDFHELEARARCLEEIVESGSESGEDKQEENDEESDKESDAGNDGRDDGWDAEGSGMENDKENDGKNDENDEEDEMEMEEESEMEMEEESEMEMEEESEMEMKEESKNEGEQESDAEKQSEPEDSESDGTVNFVHVQVEETASMGSKASGWEEEARISKRCMSEAADLEPKENKKQKLCS